MDKMLITEFERHSGLLRILLILRGEGRVNFQEFIDKYGIYSTSFYRSVKKAEQMGLIRVTSSNANRRAKKFAELTDSGKRISDELMKIENELQNNMSRPGNSV